MGFGSLAFNGEVKLLLGILVLGFVSVAELDERFRSRSLKNLGRDDFFCEPWSPLLKFISHADDGLLLSADSSLLRLPLVEGCTLSCSKSTVKEKPLDMPAMGSTSKGLL